MLRSRTSRRALLVLVAGLLVFLVAVPSVEAVKVPEPGKIGFKRVVFKTKKLKKNAKRTGEQAKRRTRRGIKRRFKLRVRNRRRVPKSVGVYARISKLKKKRNRYAADFLVFNSAAAAAREAQAPDELEPGGEIGIALSSRSRREGVKVVSTWENANIGSGKAAPAPNIVCGVRSGTSYSRLLVAPGVEGLRLPSANTLMRDSGSRACYRNVPDSFLKRLALLRVNHCTGDLSPAPPPFAATEFQIDEVCNVDKRSMGFLAPGSRQIERFLPMQTFTSCEVQNFGGGTNNFLVCQGNQPAGTHGIVRIHPTNQLFCGDTATMYLGPREQQSGQQIYTSAAAGRGLFPGAGRSCP